MSVHDQNKAMVLPLRDALRRGDQAEAQSLFCKIFADDVLVKINAPFQEIKGVQNLWDKVYAPLFLAFPDLEKRDFIVMAGPRWGVDHQEKWIGLGGNFIGLFSKDWLGIPATSRPAFMRYHEYWRIEDGKVVEVEALWDIPQLMVQAKAWPMASQLGQEWLCPGPADGQGIIHVPFDAEKADHSVGLIWEMLHELKQGDADHPSRGLGEYWHDHALWYGPTGIGTGRGHQDITRIVLQGFRKGLSDNIRHLEDSVFFGDQDLVAFTGWPSAHATHTGDGFLGLAPTGKRFERRSLDFWRIENGLITENWVMVDMIDIYAQLGINVFDRMKSMISERKVA